MIRLLHGDVRAALATLPDDHFDCVVTSPPYWGLRDYGVAGQIGLEPTLGEHLAVLVDVFREVRRVLKPSGVVWLNYGDCYAAQPNGRKAIDILNDDRTFRDKPFSTIGAIYDPTFEQTPRAGKSQNQGHTAAAHGGRVMAGGTLKPKDLCLVGSRLAIALQDDGWWVRSEVIWAKPNPMPDSSGRFRPSTSYEKIFLLSKTADHFYDYEAVMQPITASSKARLGQDVAAQRGSDRAVGKTNGRMKAVRFGGNKGGASQGSAARPRSGNEWEPVDELRLLRNVWTIPTAASYGPHFATFPPALVETALKAGCPAGGRVLDPFGGIGTTALVADGLGMDCTLIELSAPYVEIARKRLSDMFRRVEIEQVGGAS